MRPALALASLRLTARVSERVAGRLALSMFFETRPRLPEHADERPTMASAMRERMRVRGRAVTTYEWGADDETVLLVHGWRGRAAQFAPLVRDLVADGYHVVAFDAPAHGESPRAATDIRDWIAAVEQLQRRHGRFRLIVGHSFGALAALTAVRGGVTTRAVATIAGASSPRQFLDAFAAQTRLTPGTRRSFEAGFHRRLGETAASMVAHYDAAAAPLRPHVELLAVHDRSDRQLPETASARLHEAHLPGSRILLTEGWGHTRLLAADVTLDAVLAFARGGLAAVDDTVARAPADWLVRPRR